MRCDGRTLFPNLWVDVDWRFFEMFNGTKGLQFDFAQASEMLRTRTPSGTFTFDWWCPLSDVDGYGRHALAIYRSLCELDCEPVLHDVGWIDKTNTPDEILAIAENNIAKPPCRVGVTMSVPYDPKICHTSSVYKIAITQFETDRIPDFHIKQVNQCDHFITTASYSPGVWRASGLREDLPIDVMTVGVDTDFFSYEERPDRNEFRVLILGALTGRKDPRAAVRIFQRASDGDESWRLTIKTRRADGSVELLESLGFRFRKELADDGETTITHLPFPFRGRSPNDPRIEVLVNDDTSADIRDFYHRHHCLLWPSKGEGIGLPPLEAMSTGMEVVMSNNSGMADYALPELVWPIPTDHMEPASIPGGFSESYIKNYGSVGNWWVPDHNVAVEQLRAAYEAWHRGEGKGPRAADYVRANHTLELQARSVLEVIKRYGE